MDQTKFFKGLVKLIVWYFISLIKTIRFNKVRVTLITDNIIYMPWKKEVRRWMRCAGYSSSHDPDMWSMRSCGRYKHWSNVHHRRDWTCIHHILCHLQHVTCYKNTLHLLSHYYTKIRCLVLLGSNIKHTSNISHKDLCCYDIRPLSLYCLVDKVLWREKKHSGQREKKYWHFILFFFIFYSNAQNTKELFSKIV